MTEILGGAKLVQAMSDWGITYKCDFHSEKYPDYCVYQMSDKEYESFVEHSDNEWKDEYGWWQFATGSNLGKPNSIVVINNVALKAWKNEYIKKDLEAEWDNLNEDEREEYVDFQDYLDTWSSNKFNDLLEYLCEEFGASLERNVCAISVDLAKNNNLTLTELFKKCYKEH